MKVAIVCPDWFPNISGFGISVYEFATRLQLDKHTVVIITPSQKGLDPKGLSVVQVPQLFNLLGRNPFVIGLLSKLRKHASDADVVLLYSYMFEMNARVALFKRMGWIKQPVILMYRGSLENYTLPLLKPVTRWAKRIYDCSLGKFVFRNVGHILSNSKPTLQEINDRFHVPLERMSYIPNAVDVASFRQSKQDNKRVLFVGRLIENKGVMLFEDIVKVIPKDWKFTIVGDGPMEAQVKVLAARYPQIEMKGKLSQDETKRMYAASDILVLPTYAEGSPRAVLEACASGVPSIAFDVGDVPTLLGKGERGYCIPRYDIRAFCSRLNLLINDKAKRSAIGKNAHTFAKSRLSWDITYKQMIKEIKISAKNAM